MAQPYDLPGMRMGVRKVADDSPADRSGVVGLVGVVEQLPRNPMTVHSFREFYEHCGEASRFTIPEAEQLFLNGAASVILAGVKGGERARLTTPFITLEAKAPGRWGDAIAVEIKPKPAPEIAPSILLVDLFVSYLGGSHLETHTDLRIVPEDPSGLDEELTTLPGRDLVSTVNRESSVVTVEEAAKAEQFCGTFMAQDDAEQFQRRLSGGAWPSVDKYIAALQHLERSEGVDVVTVSIPPSFYGAPGRDDASKLHDALLEHVGKTSRRAQPRLAVGTMSPHTDTPVDDATRRARRIAHDRFILAAPWGVHGAVAGLLASSSPHESPTRKPLRGVDRVSHEFSRSDRQRLVQNGVLVVAVSPNPGAFIEKGVSTSGERLGATRIADQVLQGASSVAERFVGSPYSRSIVMAIEAAVHDYLHGLEKRGTLTAREGSPAYKVHAYSSDSDYEKGIVRLDIAIRPVRAIEYIYGSIVVQT